jgi:hypothetical protein
MRHSIGIALAAAALVSLGSTLAITRIPSRVAPIAAAVAEERFDAAWRDVMVPVTLKKADMEKSAFVDAPAKVTTERISPGAPASVPPVVVMVDEDKPAIRRRRYVDVCTRHGLRKITHGRRWRCRK